MNPPSESRLRQELATASRSLFVAGLNCGTAGNLSARCGAGLLITPSGMHPERIGADDIVWMSMDGEARGAHAPSSEWHLHRDLYRDRADVGAVVHTHSPFATALACQRRSIPPFHYTVARFGGDDVRCADYALFGTAELSATMAFAMRDRNACLLANHGAVVCAEDVAGAVTQAIELEFLSELYWRALQGGTPVLLTAAEMDAVGERYRGYCRLPRVIGLPPLDTQRIYKLVAAAEWQQAALEGAYCGSADDLRDGYIHLSCADQVAGTLARYFAEVADLLLLAIDPAVLGADLRFERSRGGALFPHLYAPLPVAQVRIWARRPAADAGWHLVDA
jgi:L-fuculose-phosphate aldolase